MSTRNNHMSQACLALRCTKADSDQFSYLLDNCYQIVVKPG